MDRGAIAVTRTRVLVMISSMRGGGSERQTLLLLQNLDRSRFEPHLYLSERVGELLQAVPSDVTIHSFDHVKQGRGLYYPGKLFRKQVAYLGWVLRQNKIDVVYDRTFHMTLLAGPACSRLNIPRVSTIVSPPALALPLVERRFLYWKRWLLSRAYRQSHAVIAVSRAAARSAETYYRLRMNSVQVIPNPVDYWSLTQQQYSSQRSTDAQYTTMICVGRMTAEKGHQDLIEALAGTERDWPVDARPLRVEMVGDGPLRDQLELSAAEKLRLHKIDFVGIDSSPAARIAAADALVLPSRFEGMPNVVLEAMALGTPVLATRSGGTQELQADEPTILWAEPNDSASLSSAILQFVQNREAAEERARAAMRYVCEYHDPDEATRKIESLLIATRRVAT